MKNVEAWPKDAPWPAWAAPGTKGSKVDALTADEAERWLRWLIPMPKRVRFQGKLRLPAEDMAFRLRSQATDVEQAAVAELGAFVAKQTGTAVFRNRFPILVGVAEGRVEPGVLLPERCLSPDEFLAEVSEGGVSVWTEFA